MGAWDSLSNPLEQSPGCLTFSVGTDSQESVSLRLEFNLQMSDPSPSAAQGSPQSESATFQRCKGRRHACGRAAWSCRLPPGPSPQPPHPPLLPGPARPGSASFHRHFSGTQQTATGPRVTLGRRAAPSRDQTLTPSPRLLSTHVSSSSQHPVVAHKMPPRPGLDRTWSSKRWARRRPRQKGSDGTETDGKVTVENDKLVWEEWRGACSIPTRHRDPHLQNRQRTSPGTSKS